MRKRLRKKTRRGEFMEKTLAVAWLVDPTMYHDHQGSIVDEFDRVLARASHRIVDGFGSLGEWFFLIGPARKAVAQRNLRELVTRWVNARSDVIRAHVQEFATREEATAHHRVAVDDFHRRHPEWETTHCTHPPRPYACGLEPGDRVRLRRDLVITDQAGRPTGQVHRKGEVWTVLPPHLCSLRHDVWFRRSDGDSHTWDDDASDIAEWFEPDSTQ